MSHDGGGDEWVAGGKSNQRKAPTSGSNQVNPWAQLGLSQLVDFAPHPFLSEPHGSIYYEKQNDRENAGELPFGPGSVVSIARYCISYNSTGLFSGYSSRYNR
jgi:hypothetical protein